MRKLCEGSVKKKNKKTPMCTISQEQNTDSDMKKEARWSWEEY